MICPKSKNGLSLFHAKGSNCQGSRDVIQLVKALNRDTRTFLLKNKKNLIPGLFLGLITAFFIWRSAVLGGWFHPSLAVVYGLLTLLVFVGQLANGVRTNALNIGISLAFLDLVFAGIPLEEVGEALASARLWLIIPSMIALGVHLIFRIWRWQWILKPMGDIPFGPAFRAGMIGIGGNMVLPARAGEFLRAYTIGRSRNISKTGAFATLVVERIFDGLTVLLFLILLVIFGVRDPQLKPYAMGGAAFYILALSGVIVFMAQRAWFEGLIERLLPENLAHKLLALIHGFASGLEALRDPKQLGMVTLLSLITWAVIPLSFYPILAAFDYGVPLPFFAAILMVPMLAFGLTIPGAPGGVGTFEWFGNLALLISFQVVGTPLVREEQLAAAAASVVLLHVTQSGPEALLGIWAFFKEGLTTSDLQAGQKI
jgi:uncharacterized protein (TIRG00374 family)